MRSLPFTIVRDRATGREGARFECRRCGGHDMLPLVRETKSYNPEATWKRAEIAGWRVSNTTAECPACLAGSAARAKGEIPGPKPTAEVIRMAEPKTTAREPTPQERVKIRAVLDKQFDDAAGCWLDGYSDQKAGEEVGVPWALVTRIREAAYGPIRVDPEISALRAEMTQIARDIIALNEKIGGLTDRHAAAVKRLDALTAKNTA